MPKRTLQSVNFDLFLFVSSCNTVHQDVEVEDFNGGMETGRSGRVVEGTVAVHAGVDEGRVFVDGESAVLE